MCLTGKKTLSLGACSPEKKTRPANSKTPCSTPTSALDPISTEKIEALMLELKKDYTIVIVTHNMQQAGRVADYTAFFHMGDLIEYDETENIFLHPKEKKTEDYITGRFG